MCISKVAIQALLRRMLSFEISPISLEYGEINLPIYVIVLTLTPIPT